MHCVALNPYGRIADTPFCHRVYPGHERCVPPHNQMSPFSDAQMTVHALYSERRKTLYMLHLFRTISFIMITYTTVATLLVLSYDGACIVSDIPQQVTWFG